jgi:heme exporter protein A
MPARMQNERAALAARSIHVWRGDRHVLRGVNLSLQDGELLHVRGPNGAGKTTLLRVIAGLLWAEEGEVLWQGKPIRADRDAYHRCLAFAAHEPALKSDLTALENLRYAVGLRRRMSDTELLQALDRTGASVCADLPARVLSAGQRRRVGLARVLALGARLWLLDEPFTNLDTAGSETLAAAIEAHLEAGGMALIVAHHELSLRGAVQRLSLAA